MSVAVLVTGGVGQIGHHAHGPLLASGPNSVAPDILFHRNAAEATP